MAVDVGRYVAAIGPVIVGAAAGLFFAAGRLRSRAERTTAAGDARDARAAEIPNTVAPIQWTPTVGGRPVEIYGQQRGELYISPEALENRLNEFRRELEQLEGYYRPPQEAIRTEDGIPG